MVCDKIIQFIAGNLAIHIDTPYCEVMKSKGCCLRGCESSEACGLYFNFLGIMENHSYQREPNEACMMSDFEEYFHNFMKEKIIRDRSESLDVQLGHKVVDGITYKIDEKYSDNYFSNKYTIGALYAKVIGLDTDVLGKLWFCSGSRKSLIYSQRLMNPNSSIPSLGKVYVCQIMSLHDQTGLGDRRLKFSVVGEELVHSLELNTNCIVKRVD